MTKRRNFSEARTEILMLEVHKNKSGLFGSLRGSQKGIPAALIVYTWSDHKLVSALILSAKTSVHPRILVYASLLNTVF